MGEDGKVKALCNTSVTEKIHSLYSLLLALLASAFAST